MISTAFDFLLILIWVVSFRYSGQKVNEYYAEKEMAERRLMEVQILYDRDAVMKEVEGLNQ